MEERNLKSWAEFRPTIDEIRKTYGYHEFPLENGDTYKGKNTVLFRGQSSAIWPLQTTLERRTNRKFTLMQYMASARRILPELESYTATKWNLPDSETTEKEMTAKSDQLFGVYLPIRHYEYWVYLRHYGYPSPLLDWSESPYVAAYFAMCDAHFDEKKQSTEQGAAVYVYIESTDGGKEFFRDQPLIQVQGHQVSTHKRHFIQKAWYTLALKWSEKRHDFIFCPHHEIFDKQRHRQDKLIKITIPIEDRKSALKDLNDYNINHFTLFQTEDALVKALSMEEFDL